MTATMTKAEFQALLGLISTTSPLLYVALLGNIAQVGVGWNSVGWLLVTISDVYSQSQFNTDAASFGTQVAADLAA